MPNKGKIDKKSIRREASVASLFFIGIIYLLGFLPFRFEFTKPIKQEYEDFDIYDLVYSGITNGSDDKINKEIVLIQNAESREEIAGQIEHIRLLSPRVFAIDILFGSGGDSAILRSIGNDTSIILAYDLTDAKESKDKKIGDNFFPKVQLVTQGGFVNFIGEEYSVIRSYPPFLETSEGYLSSFAVKIVQKYSADKFNRLKKRHKNSEYINFKGSIEHFHRFTAEQFAYMDSTGQLAGFFHDKIVILGGFFEGDLSELRLEDLKYTPVNSRINGKSLPDMYGIVIHANIVNMILDGSYINTVPLTVSLLITLLIIYFPLFYILSYYYRGKHPPHLKFFIFQILGVLIITYICLLCFTKLHFKIQISPMIIGLIVSLELIDLYKYFAIFLSWLTGYKYKTIFSKQHSSA